MQKHSQSIKEQEMCWDRFKYKSILSNHRSKNYHQYEIYNYLVWVHRARDRAVHIHRENWDMEGHCAT